MILLLCAKFPPFWMQRLCIYLFCIFLLDYEYVTFQFRYADDMLISNFSLENKQRINNLEHVCVYKRSSLSNKILSLYILHIREFFIPLQRKFCCKRSSRHTQHHWLRAPMNLQNKQTDIFCWTLIKRSLYIKITNPMAIFRLNTRAKYLWCDLIYVVCLQNKIKYGDDDDAAAIIYVLCLSNQSNAVQMFGI